jgi:hypothetical protein
MHPEFDEPFELRGEAAWAKFPPCCPLMAGGEDAELRTTLEVKGSALEQDAMSRDPVKHRMFELPGDLPVGLRYGLAEAVGANGTTSAAVAAARDLGCVVYAKDRQRIITGHCPDDGCPSGWILCDYHGSWFGIEFTCCGFLCYRELDEDDCSDARARVQL